MNIEFPESLPITQKIEEISSLLKTHQVLIVAGETGSGKSTQLPKICLSLGLAQKGKIGHTQPRRLAARNVAARLAEELQCELGSLVGYQVRFHDQFNAETKIKLMTDGILLAEIQQDRLLRQYDVLIIDEAHERSLNIDFLLGYLKQLIAKRPDLKIIITSATIDHVKFSRHFNNAPIIEVSGRTYPVEMRYRPLNDEEEGDQTQAVIKAVDELSAEGHGDILVFLSTEREIHETSEALKKYDVKHYEIVPLYARLSMSEQQKAFHPGAKRRIILSTNVAETSITVPRIHYVIDTGLVRISRYNYKNKVQRLPIEPISQASANQRAGRCGRIAPGICIRLYSKEDFQAREKHTEPEILRTNLASIILQMAVFRLGKIEEFPFIDSPDRKFINDGYRLLQELQAIDYSDKITENGRTMAKFPIDPRLARMILAAVNFNCLREVLVIVSCLSVQDPRERPKEFQQQADAKHQRYHHAASDFLSLLNLWEHYHYSIQAHSQNKIKQYCKANFLSIIRMREWSEIYRQLLEACRSLKWKVPIEQFDSEIKEYSAQDYQKIHQALLTGSLGLVGQWLEDRTYLGPRAIKFQIFPGSRQAKLKPKWLMAASFMETTQIFAVTVAKIEPEWLEKLAPHLIKKSYAEPHWEKNRAEVVAFEKVTLYGLEIVAKRKVNYARIDPQLSRELFIRHALVMGEFKSHVPFIVHNQQQLINAETLEHKGRRRGIIVDESQLEAFYEKRLPDNIVSGIEFEKWAKTLSPSEQQNFYWQEEDIVTDQAKVIQALQFPDFIEIGQAKLPLSYRFEPGETDDGVSVKVPLAMLNQLTEEVCQWLVAGLLKEKLTELIRGLPKAIRRNFVPAPNFAEVCYEKLLKTDRSQSLFQAFSDELKRMTGVDVPIETWISVELPEHLKMNIQILDQDGRIIKQGRSLKELKQFLSGEMRETAASMHSALEQSGLTNWDFGRLPEQVSIKQGKLQVLAYPTIIAEEDSVAIKAVPDKEEAERLTQIGLRQLFMLQCKKELRELKSLPGLNTLSLKFAGSISKQEFIDDFAAKIFDRVFLVDGIIRSKESFDEALKHRGQLYAEGLKLVRQLESMANPYQELMKLFSRPVPDSFAAAYQDMQAQLKALIYPYFMQNTPDEWFKRLGIYLQAILKRVDKLRQNPEKDRQNRLVIQNLSKAYQASSEIKKARLDGADFKWMTEELRVSLFAQELKTVVSVSEQRLKKLLQS